MDGRAVCRTRCFDCEIKSRFGNGTTTNCRFTLPNSNGDRDDDERQERVRPPSNRLRSCPRFGYGKFRRKFFDLERCLSESYKKRCSFSIISHRKMHMPAVSKSARPPIVRPQSVTTTALQTQYLRKILHTAPLLRCPTNIWKSSVSPSVLRPRGL